MQACGDVWVLAMGRDSEGMANGISATGEGAFHEMYCFGLVEGRRVRQRVLERHMECVRESADPDAWLWIKHTPWPLGPPAHAPEIG